MLSSYLPSFRSFFTVLYPGKSNFASIDLLQQIDRYRLDGYLSVTAAPPSSQHARHGLRRICSRPRHSRSLGFSRKKNRSHQLPPRARTNKAKQGQWPAAARTRAFSLSLPAKRPAQRQVPNGTARGPLFAQFDADGDGKLDIYEIARAFRALRSGL